MQLEQGGTRYTGYYIGRTALKSAHYSKLSLMHRECGRKTKVKAAASLEIYRHLEPLIANVNYAVARPSLCRLSVTLVRPTQAVEIFGNISTAFGTFAIR